MRLSIRRARAFTLIELLVVIAIIAVVIALLIPPFKECDAAMNGRNFGCIDLH